jgi:TM2 domain-containing membrane protein YozV
MSGQGSAGNVLAALCNVFIPGLGQLIQGNVLSAIVIFMLVTIGYALWFLIVPVIFAGLIHLWSIYDAAMFKPDSYFER